MDGVLADFESRYEQKFGEFPGNVDRRRQHFWDNWNKWVDDKEFETLPILPGAQQLIDFVNELVINQGWKAEILSSSSGGYSHEMVKKQKKEWLKKHNINYKANIVPGRSHKAKFAKSNTILIDDNKDIISSFIEAGGVGIMHDYKNADDTIELVEKIAQSMTV